MVSDIGVALTSLEIFAVHHRRACLDIVTLARPGACDDARSCSFSHIYTLKDEHGTYKSPI